MKILALPVIFVLLAVVAVLDLLALLVAKAALWLSEVAAE